MNTAPIWCRRHGHHRFSAIRASLSEDILRYLNKSPENQAAGDTLKSRLGALMTPNLLALLLYRVAHYLYVNGWPRSARLVTSLNSLIHRVSIPPQSCIGPGCFLPHPAGVTFCGTAGQGLTLYSQAVCCPGEVFLEGPVEAGPHLGNRVTLGGQAVVVGPITVGDDAKVAFSTRLDRDAPAGVIVVSRALRAIVRPRPDGHETASSM